MTPDFPENFYGLVYTLDYFVFALDVSQFLKFIPDFGFLNHIFLLTLFRSLFILVDFNFRRYQNGLFLDLFLDLLFDLLYNFFRKHLQLNRLILQLLLELHKVGRYLGIVAFQLCDDVHFNGDQFSLHDVFDVDEVVLQTFARPHIEVNRRMRAHQLPLQILVNLLLRGHFVITHELHFNQGLVLKKQRKTRSCRPFFVGFLHYF